MSGAFELVPNPTILVVQTGMFFAAAGVVKKLYVDPYLKLKARREEKTSASNIKGSLSLDEFETRKNFIKSKLNDTRLKASQAMDTVKKSAELEREKMLTTARESLEKEYKDKLVSLSEDFKKESEKVASVALVSAEKMAKLLLG